MCSSPIPFFLKLSWENAIARKAPHTTNHTDQRPGNGARMRSETMAEHFPDQKQTRKRESIHGCRRSRWCTRSWCTSDPAARTSRPSGTVSSPAVAGPPSRSASGAWRRSAALAAARRWPVCSGEGPTTHGPGVAPGTGMPMGSVGTGYCVRRRCQVDPMMTDNGDCPSPRLSDGVPRHGFVGEGVWVCKGPCTMGAAPGVCRVVSRA